jgi:hypothetical protein
MSRTFIPVCAALAAGLTLAACTDNPTAPPESTSQVHAHRIRQVCDFVTGGGFVIVNGKRINFGFNVGITSGGVRFGHINVVDRLHGVHLSSTAITLYGDPVAGPLSDLPTTRVADGRARFTTASGTRTGSFSMRVTDLGEPGTSDWFRLTMSFGGTNITIDSQQLDGGNIQLHNHCRNGPPR